MKRSHSLLPVLFPLLLASCDVVTETTVKHFGDGGEWVLKEYLSGQKGIFVDEVEVYKGRIDSYEVRELKGEDPVFEISDPDGKTVYDTRGVQLTDRGNEQIDFVIDRDGYPIGIIAKGQGVGLYGMNGSRLIGKDAGYQRIVYDDYCYLVYRDEKEGACNLLGQEIIPPGVYDGVSCALLDNDSGSYILAGFYVGKATNGSTPLLLKGNFSDKSFGANGLIGFCNTAGVERVPPVYKKMRLLHGLPPSRLKKNSEFFMLVMDEGENYGLYSRGGNMVVRMGKYGEEHDGIHVLSDEKSYQWLTVYENKDGSVKSILDTTGTVIMAHETAKVRYKDGRWIQVLYTEDGPEYKDYVFPKAEGRFSYTILGATFTDWVKLFDDGIRIGDRFYPLSETKNGLNRYFNMRFDTNVATTTSNFYTNDDLSFLYKEDVCTGNWGFLPPSVERTNYYRVSDDFTVSYAGVVPSTIPSQPYVGSGFNPGAVPATQTQDNRQYRVKEITTYEDCWNCGGKGKVIKDISPVSFSVDDSRYCAECGRVTSPHAHVDCNVCHGRGKIEKKSYQTVYE